jgi:putative ABC transport system permease protein
LFIAVSSFLWTLNKSIEMEYGGFDFDVMVLMDNAFNRQEEVRSALGAIPGAKIRAASRTTLSTIVPNGFITENAPVPAGENSAYAMLLSPMEDEELARLMPQAQGGLSGLLINTAVFTRDNKKQESVPFAFESGTVLPLLLNAEDGRQTRIGEVSLGAAVTEVPDSVSAMLLSGASVNVFVAESEYNALVQANAEALGDRVNLAYLVNTAYPEAFYDAASAALESMGMEEESDYSLMDISRMSQLNRNIMLIVMLFGYGFIAMLSLIGVTSVIATISTSMALRRQEFAMLYSVGMTPEGMDKMLNLESLMYGAKSLIIGIPIGLALSYVLHKSVGGTLVFAFRPPYEAVLIGAAAVLLLTFCTMRYGKWKLRRLSIVEAIRSETL